MHPEEKQISAASGTGTLDLSATSNHFVCPFFFLAKKKATSSSKLGEVCKAKLHCVKFSYDISITKVVYPSYNGAA